MINVKGTVSLRILIIFLDFRVETFKTEMVDLLSMSSNRLRYLE